jgi:hypothetical protein
MKTLKWLVPALLLGAALWQCGGERAEALFRGRQYYGGWRHYPSRSYYYRYYYYKPYDDYDGYDYQYTIYYPSTPRYYYYYNPHRRLYWGRLDLEAKDENKYSILAEKDRKKELSDIPEEAFPKPGKLPPIPGSKDGVAMEAPTDGPPKKEDEK